MDQYTTLFGQLVSRKPGMIDQFNILMLTSEPSTSKLDIELAKILLLESDLGSTDEILQLQEMATALFNSAPKPV